jgi:hypothetical protein
MMCQVCNDLKDRIEQARRHRSAGLDTLTRSRIDEMIKDLEAELREHARLCQAEPQGNSFTTS